MFIELTDHLICPADHPEQYLVLLPDRMEGRRVVSGELGCPGCGRVVRVRDGVADFGAPPEGPAPAAPTLTGEAVEAFLGLSGPGGFVALAGAASSLAAELTVRIPGVALALVNPPPGVADTVTASVLRATRLPLKSGSMRGVVLGSDLATTGPEGWIADAVRAVLPGLRVVAEGGEPPPGVEVLARSPDCWVGRKRTAPPPRG